VNDLVAGSGLEFTDRGLRALAGVPGELRLLAVVCAEHGTAEVPGPSDEHLRLAPSSQPRSDLFIGRVRELERLDEALAATASGNGATVLVSGDAGIGKTRLASEVAARARADGFTVIVGRCLDLVGTELPYQPFADALRSAAPDLPWG